ncbi:MAG: hypothetical protein COV34_01295 [Candidatus Zambryskibacteria bacterium CG10_big_fil_rev_8_21_14_0_10_42_12]|uniref:Uncharacterized protein n=1 Tax=Candidatus Zambryskibacteria bacterium CG10_big_fil_rev_8_21_14_0_10_42_12 TaxID=1975115 RepID=A0A2H0QVD9_9BACT|nr:MAG: hypothetical protein COV34_01295 [Candidatus Zambryskibacteria bacterium CG10_big_fil_rev_8_21_14_0_10_42_12]
MTVDLEEGNCKVKIKAGGGEIYVGGGILRMHVEYFVDPLNGFGVISAPCPDAISRVECFLEPTHTLIDPKRGLKVRILTRVRGENGKWVMQEGKLLILPVFEPLTDELLGYEMETDELFPKPVFEKNLVEEQE